MCKPRYPLQATVSAFAAGVALSKYCQGSRKIYCFFFLIHSRQLYPFNFAVQPQCGLVGEAADKIGDVEDALIV